MLLILDRIIRVSTENILIKDSKIDKFLTSCLVEQNNYIRCFF